MDLFWGACYVLVKFSLTCAHSFDKDLEFTHCALSLAGSLWLTLHFLRTLQFPLGSPDSGHLKPIKGKGGFSQWIVINYSPYSSHLKRSCFL